ncbi:hypothetical protein [Halomonas sp.]|nr:hypothetical protein [Halomonas sp.]
MPGSGLMVLDSPTDTGLEARAVREALGLLAVGWEHGAEAP